MENTDSESMDRVDGIVETTNVSSSQITQSK